MIKLDEKTVGIWYMQTTPTSDWLCSIREIEPDAKYELDYRFRYYEDDKAFDSKDRKSWYKAEVTATRHFAIVSIRTVANEMHKAGATGEVYELINEGDFDAFSKKFLDAPFAYARAATKEEAEEAMMKEKQHEESIR